MMALLIGQPRDCTVYYNYSFNAEKHASAEGAAVEAQHSFS